MIKIQIGDWLKNAGIVGLSTVLARLQTPELKIIEKEQYIEFDEKLLDGFEDKYFEVLIDKHEKSLSWYKLISQEYVLNNLEDKKESVEKLNKIIDEIKSKVNSNSYKNAYLILKDSEIIENLIPKIEKIKITKKQDFNDVKEEYLEQIRILTEIIEYFKKPNVKKVIAAKNVMYEVIQPFWTNVSFLLKTNNKKEMYSLYKADFIDSVKKYNEKDNSKNKYNCFTCENKISKLSKPEAFDLTWIVKTGVDMARKSSHFWELKGDAYICPICNLVYSCIPIGFTTLKGKGLFINNNGSIRTLKTSNVAEVSYESEKFEEIEQASYLRIVNTVDQYGIENIDKEFENIQIVKFDSSNGSRPYSFNVLSKTLLRIIYYNRKRLQKLIKVIVKVTDKYYINLYSEVIDRLYVGKDLFDLIHMLMKMNLGEEYKGTHFIYSILEINNSFKGGRGMRFEDTKNFKNYGLNLRRKYVESGNESKISGITYRLLNALKTKDSSKFMDTMINAYMYVKLEIPTDFVKGLNNMDALQGIGYAFLIGLQGVKEIKEEGEN
ncbi:type I-B CRISPR-associated protein Cas8b1/Cst1 [Clostridium baratii]|uniref:type I-B CRISPR-associated protein Cas8b1/Cst1 n=1 Tax=Clostridium baratii TaxID=1561 RepID=UPI001FA7CE9C|nr:type I-B CRISPR-associated protein Cas8b1/Cst1 [Clostridium baratii]